MKHTITLHGGPWNGRVIRDRGTTRIRMGIARKWRGNRPAAGSETGCAVYAPTPERDRAHYVECVWEGTCTGIIEAN